MKEDHLPAKVEAEKNSAAPVALTDMEVKVLEAVPVDNYITEDEILMKVDDLDLDDLVDILLKLDLKNCIEENAGRYKRK